VSRASLFLVVGLVGLLPPFALGALLLPVGQYPAGAISVAVAAIAATVLVARLAHKQVQRHGLSHVLWLFPVGAVFTAFAAAVCLFSVAALSGRVEPNDEAGFAFAFYATLPLTVPLCLVGGLVQALVVALIAGRQGGQR